jgi:Protein of unknown function (DUF2934)
LLIFGGFRMSSSIKEMSNDIQKRVREVAYLMWEAAGRQQGMAMEYWLSAERDVMSTMQRAADRLMPKDVKGGAAAKSPKPDVKAETKPATPAKAEPKPAAPPAAHAAPAAKPAAAKAPAKAEAAPVAKKAEPKAASAAQPAPRKPAGGTVPRAKAKT